MREIDGQGSKKKLFAIYSILKKYSDDQHPVNSVFISEKLESLYGITAERKSIYRDIEVLISCGISIEKMPKRGYYFADRTFEIPEVRLLNDAILGARFITWKKTKELSIKLRNELSIYQAKKIESQTYFDNRVKFENEQILYVIDTIHSAIAEGKKVKFAYYRKIIQQNRIHRIHTKDHTVSPYSLVWSNDNYYLVGNKDCYDNISHFRIDRMENIEITSENSRNFEEVSEYKNNFDIGDYIGKTFQMYSGTEEEIELICCNSILERMIDKFGTKVDYISWGADHFRLHAHGYDSIGLVDWLMRLADRCYVKSPISLRERVIERAKKVIEMQENFNCEEALFSVKIPDEDTNQQDENPKV